MARYDREFLVPYLQNVCAAHLAKRRVIRDQSKLGRELDRQNNISRNGGIENPIYPNRHSVMTAERFWALLLGIVFIGLFLVSLCAHIISPAPAGFFAFIVIICLGAGLPCLIGSIYLISRDMKSNNQMIQAYNNAVIRTNQERKQNIAKANSAIPGLQQQFNQCESELNRLRNLQEKLYGANIIPRQYRNVYAAMYLYDWFSTSGADDLDHALSMFVLEEIKERLDKVIDNQTDMLLNQQIMIANQYRSIELQERHQSELVSKLNRIEASNEERNRYLGMIEGNTATIAYFSAAEYYCK